MKRLLILMLTALFLICRSQPNNTRSVVIFLHNRFIEDYGPSAMHPEYGKASYYEIIQALEKEQLYVVSRLRPKNADINEYAVITVKQIDSLIKAGVKPTHITVIGTSKGGYIAMRVSSQLKNADVNFVFIGSCTGNASSPGEYSLCGNVLSIYEKSDLMGRSCASIKQQSSCTVFKEIELNTGLKHGFLFRPMPEWIEPCVKWAKGDKR